MENILGDSYKAYGQSLLNAYLYQHDETSAHVNAYIGAEIATSLAFASPTGNLHRSVEFTSATTYGTISRKLPISLAMSESSAASESTEESGSSDIYHKFTAYIDLSTDIIDQARDPFSLVIDGLDSSPIPVICMWYELRTTFWLCVRPCVIPPSGGHRRYWVGND
ncbi:hypothetical protein ANCCAN_14910 [Ancylostoma caninum]|uniref:Uncharacterized protein n=1 Tax=Ancylostoma caninum TaxID=29170 RepID=A0A368G3Y9_ANCCA|nr:hypothetical protein ANCCAN_14910 [Ancylostoma caninum]